jgi:soluble lytic murein transglycosylase
MGLFPRFSTRSLVVAALAAGAAPASADTLQADLATARLALAALSKYDYVKARALAAVIRDPHHNLALRWRLAQLKDAGFSFAELTELQRAVKDWPGAARIAERAEEAIDGTTADAAVIAWFKESPPRGAKGWTAYISALARSGREDEAREAARRAWTGLLMPAAEESAFRDSFGTHLRPEDDRARLLLLLRAKRTTQAEALWSRAVLPAEEKAATALRLVMQGSKSAPAEVEAQIARLPPAIRAEADFRFDEINWHRRAERYEAAAKVLAKMRIEEDEQRRWRNEANLVVRELVAGDKAKPAYAAAAVFAPQSGESWAAMEFLAGWIALRKLKQPAQALPHFQRLFEKSGASISKARGAYWAGRAAAARGDKKAAQRWYTAAVAYPHAFYGQLAAAELGHDRLELPADVPVDEAARKALAEEPRVRAAEFLVKLEEWEAVHALLLDLAMEAQDALRWAALADLAANGIGRREIAVRAARRAAIKNVPLFGLGFPTLALPPDVKVEPALVFAIVRQESEFHKDAVSSAGARGLMQLMPAAARETAQRLKLTYDAAKLNADEAYNLRIGGDFLNRLVERFGGSYVLAAAAYNGGPGNLNKWLKRYGEPREGADLIDWIETIPFDETRNYVQRVLENLTMYRNRMGQRSLARTAGTLWRPPVGDALKPKAQPSRQP